MVVLTRFIVNNAHAAIPVSDYFSVLGLNMNRNLIQVRFFYGPVQSGFAGI